jgi:hypothetical protein
MGVVSAGGNSSSGGGGGGGGGVSSSRGGGGSGKLAWMATQCRLSCGVCTTGSLRSFRRLQGAAAACACGWTGWGCFQPPSPPPHFHPVPPSHTALMRASNACTRPAGPPGYAHLELLNVLRDPFTCQDYHSECVKWKKQAGCVGQESGFMHLHCEWLGWWGGCARVTPVQGSRQPHGAVLWLCAPAL